MRIRLVVAAVALACAGFPASAWGAGWSGSVVVQSYWNTGYLSGGTISDWTLETSTWSVLASRGGAARGTEGDTWTHPAAVLVGWVGGSRYPCGPSGGESLSERSGGGVSGAPGANAESPETVAVTIDRAGRMFTVVLESESSFPLTTTRTACDGVRTTQVAMRRPEGWRLTEQLPADFRRTRRVAGIESFSGGSRVWSVTWNLELHDPTYDIWPPRTRIQARPARVGASSVATFRFSSDEARSSFGCRLDGGPWKPCRSPKTYRRVRPGAHTFRVRARDRAGNVDATPARYTWRVR
jgi:hypothetical protein